MFELGEFLNEVLASRLKASTSLKSRQIAAKQAGYGLSMINNMLSRGQVLTTSSIKALGFLLDEAIEQDGNKILDIENRKEYLEKSKELLDEFCLEIEEKQTA